VWRERSPEGVSRSAGLLDRTFPYLDRVTEVRLEPQQLVDKLKASLKQKGILTNPQVTLVVKQYASKK